MFPDINHLIIKDKNMYSVYDNDDENWQHVSVCILWTSIQSYILQLCIYLST